MDLKEINIKNSFDELNHWWIKTRFLYLNNTINSLISSKHYNLAIIEFGSGTAPNLRLLQNKPHSNYCLHACDIAYECDHFTNGISYTKLPPPDKKFDLIIAMDVLEHIQDEKNVLNTWHNMLKENGLIFCTVPAFKYLWSEHDIFLEHYRRYHRDELRRLFLHNHFEIISINYFFSFLFLPLFLIRKFLNQFKIQQGINKQNKIFNQVLYFLGFVEFHLALRFKIPFGTSLFLIAQKNKLSSPTRTHKDWKIHRDQNCPNNTTKTHKN
jgi:SAM-dependent methyltransferase